jgi:DNA invertase Pin-like site-specific DNA recombinase
VGKAIGYLRVSTKGQGDSGLGLEAQKAAIESFAQQSNSKITHWYTEVESGTRADRPELKKALAHAKRTKAKLVVAKLDRLARDVEFFAGVMNSGADFVALDNPAANRLTLHILAAVAEAEAKAISERTRVALQAAKARGIKLGSARPDHWTGACKRRPEVSRHEARLQGARAGAVVAGRVLFQQAREAYADILPQMQKYRDQGLSLQHIADRLNDQGHTTRKGKSWNPVQVLRVLQRG